MAHITVNESHRPSDGARLEANEMRTRTGSPWRLSQLARADRWVLALLVAIPVVVEVLPALAGHLALGGDDLSQNYPTRVLVGELLRHGRLPLWDPYIWSGTPLLAGWNAGALYPGTWVFAILPAEAAWVLNVVSVSVICGVGLYVFLRRLSCSPLASLLGALSFTYAGFMGGQSGHYGLVAGMSYTPWMLLAIHELAASPEPRAARRWVALLGSCAGLVVLAGDPRSVSSAGIIALVYYLAVCWRSWRAGLRPTTATVGVLTGLVVALLLSAAQWLPGLSFLHQSERAAATFTSFAAGSLTWHDLELLFVPGLVGADGLGLPGFAGAYNLPELSFAVGIVPLVAAFALFPRALRRRPRGAELGVWYVLIAVGIVLTAGANDPLGHFLASIPLYGGQRLQNRNSVLVDFALAVLLALFVDVVAGRVRGPGREVASSRGRGGLSRIERLAGLAPPAIVAALVLAAYLFSHWVQGGLGVGRYRPSLPIELTPYFVAMLVLSAGAAVLLLAARRLGAPRTRWLVAAVVVLNLLVSFATTPSVAAESPATKTAVSSRTTDAAELSGLLGRQARYAIFNPLQSVPSDLVNTIDEIGPFDLGILHDLYSVQGYGSAVAGSYEDVTGAHEVENLQPAALSRANLDVLDLKELVTLPQYLVAAVPANKAVPIASGAPVAPGTEPAAEALNALAPGLPPANVPPFLLEEGLGSDWILPGPVALDSLSVVLVPYRHELPSSVRVGLLNAKDEITGWHQVRLSGSKAELGLNGQVAYGISIRAPSTTAVVVGAVAVTTVRPFELGYGPVSRRLVLNQILQGLLEPPRWRYQTEIGGLPVFTNTSARGTAWLEPAGSKSALVPSLAGGRVTTPAVEPWQDPVTLVSTPRPALLVRSAAYASGWTATITPLKGGDPKTVAVRRLGVVEAISVPAGNFTVTWSYGSSLAKLGLLASVLGVLALIALAFTPRRRRPRRGAGRVAGPADA